MSTDRAELLAEINTLQSRLDEANADNMRLTDALAEAKRESAAHECAAVAKAGEVDALRAAIAHWLDLTAHNIEMLRAELGLNEGRVKH